MSVTKTQRQILKYVVSYIAEHHQSPSYREIAEHFGYRSVATVHGHIRGLVEKGELRMPRYGRRAIEVNRAAAPEAMGEPLFPAKEWLDASCDLRPITPTAAGGCDLAGVRQYRERWRVLRSRMAPGDEMWTFVTPPPTWVHHCGRAGYALVREGRVVDAVVTYDQMGEPDHRRNAPTNR